MPVEDGLRVVEFIRDDGNASPGDRCTLMFIDIVTIEPLPSIRCPCDPPLPYEDGGDVNVGDVFHTDDYEDCIPLPLRPTLRHPHVVGEEVYFAQTCCCRFVEFLQGQIVDNNVNDKTCNVRIRSMLYSVPYNCIYVLNHTIMNSRCKDAIMTWTHVASHFKFVKDIRILIGKMLLGLYFVL